MSENQAFNLDEPRIGNWRFAPKAAVPLKSQVAGVPWGSWGHRTQEKFHKKVPRQLVKSGSELLVGRIIPGLDGEIFYSDLDQTVFDRPGLDGGHTGLCPNPNWGSEPAHKPLYPLNRLAKSRCQRLFISTKMKFRLQRINHPLFSVTSFTVSSLNISPYCDLYSTRYVTNLREAPLKLAAPLFGHCPNSDYTHTHTHTHPALKRALSLEYSFATEFITSQTILEFAQFSPSQLSIGRQILRRLNHALELLLLYLPYLLQISYVFHHNLFSQYWSF